MNWTKFTDQLPPLNNGINISDGLLSFPGIITDFNQNIKQLTIYFYGSHGPEFHNEFMVHDWSVLSWMPLYGHQNDELIDENGIDGKIFKYAYGKVSYEEQLELLGLNHPNTQDIGFDIKEAWHSLNEQGWHLRRRDINT